MFFYLDESGCTGALPAGPNSEVQPVLVVGGLLVHGKSISTITNEFVDLKKSFRFSVPRDAKRMDIARQEIKGASLRKVIRKKGDRAQRQIKFVDSLFALLQRHDARIVASIWVKEPGMPFDGQAVYTTSVQRQIAKIHRIVEPVASQLAVIADSRNSYLNSVVAHSVFTQKYRQTGDAYPCMPETPTFGHSENHAGLQIADIILSAVVWPMAAHAYQFGRINSSLVRREDSYITRHFGKRLRLLSALHVPGQQFSWGIHVAGVSERLSTAKLFEANTN